MSGAKRLKLLHASDPWICFYASPTPLTTLHLASVPTLLLPKSTILRWNIPYFSCLVEGVGLTSAAETAQVRLYCSSLQGSGASAWNYLFDVLCHGSAGVPDPRQRPNVFNVAMLVNYVFPSKDHPLAQAMLEHVRQTTTQHVARMEPSWVKQLLDLGEHQFLRRMVGNTVCQASKFYLPDDESDLAAYLRLGSALRGFADEEYWIRWSRSVLSVPDPCMARWALVSLSSAKKEQVEACLGKWMGGFDMAACLRRHAAVLAGGALVAALCCPDAALPPDSDIDVWVLGKKLKTLLSMVQDVLVAFPDCVVVLRGPIVQLVCPRWTAALQFIFTDAVYPWLITHHFDMDYVKAYFDGESVFQHPECAVAWRDAQVTRMRTGSIEQRRIDKAQEKGFAVRVPEGTHVFPHHASKRHRYFRPHPDDPWEYVQAVWRALWPGCDVVRTWPEVVASFRGCVFRVGSNSVANQRQRARDTQGSVIQMLDDVQVLAGHSWRQSFDVQSNFEFHRIPLYSEHYVSHCVELEMTTTNVRFARRRLSHQKHCIALHLHPEDHKSIRAVLAEICTKLEAALQKKFQRKHLAGMFPSFSEEEGLRARVNWDTRWNFVGGKTWDLTSNCTFPCATVRLSFASVLILEHLPCMYARAVVPEITVYANKYVARRHQKDTYALYVYRHTK